MIKEVFCSEELSNKLREKGFDGYSTPYSSLIESGSIPLSVAMDWIREIYHYHVQPFPEYGEFEIMPGQYEDSFHGFSVDIVNLKYGEWIKTSKKKTYYPTYNRACEFGVEYILENLI